MADYISKYYDSGESIDAAIYHNNRQYLDQIGQDFINILNNIQSQRAITDIIVKTSIEEQSSAIVTYTFTTNDGDKGRKTATIKIPYQLPTYDVRSKWSDNIDYVLRKDGQWYSSTNYWTKENKKISLSSFYNVNEDTVMIGNATPSTDTANGSPMFEVGYSDGNTNSVFFSVRKSGRTYINDLYLANLHGAHSNPAKGIDCTDAVLFGGRIQDTTIQNATLKDPKMDGRFFSSSTIPFIETTGFLIGEIGEAKVVNNRPVVDPITVPFANKAAIPVGMALSMYVGAGSDVSADNSPAIVIKTSDDQNSHIPVVSPAGKAITYAKIAGKVITVRYYNENFYLASGGGCDFLDINETITTKQIFGEEYQNVPLYIIGINDNIIYGKMYGSYTNNHGTFYTDGYFSYNPITNEKTTNIVATGNSVNQSHLDPKEMYFNNTNNNGSFYYVTTNSDRPVFGYMNPFDDSDSNWYVTLSSAELSVNRTFQPRNIYREEHINKNGSIVSYAQSNVAPTHPCGYFVKAYNKSKINYTLFEDTGSIRKIIYIQVGNWIIGSLYDSYSTKTGKYVLAENNYRFFVHSSPASSTSPNIVPTAIADDQLVELICSNNLFVTNYKGSDGFTAYLINTENQLIKWVITTNTMTRSIEKTYDSTSLLYNSNLQVNTTVDDKMPLQNILCIDNQYYGVIDKKLVNIFDDNDQLEMNINTDPQYIASGKNFVAMISQEDSTKIYILN